MEEKGEEAYNQILEDLTEYLNTYIDDEYRTDALEQLVCDLDDRGVVDFTWIELY